MKTFYLSENLFFFSVPEFWVLNVWGLWWKVKKFYSRQIPFYCEIALAKNLISTAKGGKQVFKQGKKSDSSSVLHQYLNLASTSVREGIDKIIH